MTSSKLILIFLAFIFLIIVVLSSSRISGALRTRFGKLMPSLNPTGENITPTVTPTIEAETTTPTPTIVYGGKYNTTTGTGTTSSATKIPATGPEDLVWLVLGGSFFAGITLKKITSRKS